MVLLFYCQVYQEYIHDRHHTHMNSTQWETLTDFVKWLGKEGHCVVDETEKGWFIQYVDRDPETIRRQDALQKKEKMDLDDEERRARFIQQQIERSNKDSDVENPMYTEIQRQTEDEKVEFRLPVAPVTKKVMSAPIPSSSAFNSDPATSDKAHKKSEASASSSSSKKRKSALDEIMEMEEEQKKMKQKKMVDSSSASTVTWLMTGIVVKVVTPKLGEKYYRKKGVVMDIVDKYSGVIRMLDSGDRIRVDEAHLETVIPALGKPVLILYGEHRGMPALLESINEARFCCSVRLQSGQSKGQIVHSLQYEHISKRHLIGG